jgi:hypothetical protein
MLICASNGRLNINISTANIAESPAEPENAIGEKLAGSGGSFQPIGLSAG